MTAMKSDRERAFATVLASIYDAFGSVPKSVGDALTNFKEVSDRGNLDRSGSVTGARELPPPHDAYLRLASALVFSLQEPLARALEREGL